MDCPTESTCDDFSENINKFENDTPPGKETEGKPDAYRPSAEELVTKAIAPVKSEYIRPAPCRSSDTKDESVQNAASSKISANKKSRRQLKRERKQEVGQTLCSAVARTGDVQACPYKESCRFSHNLELLTAQKLPDLPGECPFLSKPGPCPYGATCRFSGTHLEQNSLQEERLGKDNSHEMNVLSKDFQKLMWKNAIKFSKADAHLENLGIMNKGKQQKKGMSGQRSATNACSSNVSLCSYKSEKDGAEISAENNANISDVSLGNELSNHEDNPPLKKSKATDSGIAVSLPHGNGCDEASRQESIYFATTERVDASEHDKETKLNMREKKLIDFSDKLYLAPLTTVGNLPFRRLCKGLGADITCGEMAMCSNLLQGQASEWALLRRHSNEDFFGVQICGGYPDLVAHTVEVIEQECTIDFIDINMGCPIDIVVNKGAGSSLLTRPTRMYNMIKAASRTMENPLTVKVRTGYFEGRNCMHSMISDIGESGAVAVTIHGRTRQQRYSKLADWDYIYQCAREAPECVQVIGNGDIFSYTDYNDHMSKGFNISTCMIARGALIKPWIFTEIKEQRHWDISSTERLDLLRDYVRFGLQHWGSDKKGVETTRRFLLEWLSYLCRYIPVGLLDILPQRINWRPPSYFGRNDLETLMASDSAADWVRISEMLLGPVPEGFTFTPKHKSNAYDKAENG
eukprot:TRINITY_DN16611_c0_g1_i1.p1 TRINITY_DN16611_c0_g1~~TRINITY_DN16611_c0_g1_i1.p1  ORF type:complete len:690 (-),score=134.67 TRINITY_DN16611_c0_g1_i1:223-2292(-)